MSMDIGGVDIHVGAVRDMLRPEATAPALSLYESDTYVAVYKSCDKTVRSNERRFCLQL